MKKVIAVVGSDGVISEEAKASAERVGEDIAKAGCVLLCGGHGGVMEAACRGAKKADGLTLGVLSEMNKDLVNPYVDIALPTSLGYARNTIVASAAEAVIAVAGSVGTLSEIAFALNYNKPVVVVEGTGGVADFLPQEIPSNRGEVRLHPAKPEEAVDLALKLSGGK
ncbi:TIGR00725 family protein [Candidatus Altiarchaeota archaeon]